MVSVKKITDLSELDTMPKLEIVHEHWEVKKHVRSYASMGIYQDKEWVVKITAIEEDPLKTYLQDDDPVYLDSAVEFFLNMEPEREDARYFNFEMNANGALLAEFGWKKNRKKIKQLTDKRVQCIAKQDEKEWSVLLRIPLDLIDEICGKKVVEDQARFTFNLYKISETKEQEHYVTYAPIDNEYPDFHLPKFFGEGILQLGNM